MDISMITNFILEHLDIFIVICCYILGEVIKKCDKIDNEFIMLINAFVGVAIAISFNGFAVTGEIVKTGVCSGLFATVVYEAIKNTMQNFGNG
jgi:hypothetical protein